MGWSIPWLSFCSSTAPAPLALTSTSILNGPGKSGATRNGVLHSRALQDSNDFWQSGDQEKGVFLLVRSNHVGKIATKTLVIPRHPQKITALTSGTGHRIVDYGLNFCMDWTHLTLTYLFSKVCDGGSTKLTLGQIQGEVCLL